MADSPKKYGPWIAGGWHQPEQGHYQITGPATEEPVGYASEGHASEGHAAEVWIAAKAARSALREWSCTDPGERADVLERAGALISDRVGELVPLVRAESGATTSVAESNLVLAAADCFRRAARSAREFGPVVRVPQPVAASLLSAGGLIGVAARRRPLGVVGCITSHNFPIAHLVAMVAPAVAMGNTVVAKPAPQDPLGFLELGPIMKEAGVPDGVFNVVTGSGPITNEALIANYDIDIISFSGTAAMGRRIAEFASKQLKTTRMVLGGKGVVIVLEDADDRALELAVLAGSLNFSLHSGQVGPAPARMLVHRSLYEKVVDGLARHAQSVPVGNPADHSTVVGPLISDAQRDHVEAAVEEARQQGARVAAGGERSPIKPGFYTAPHVLADVTEDMAVAREGIAGPVVVVIPFDDEDEAVRIAGGGAPAASHDYVFSGDAAHAWGVATRLRGGSVGINTAELHPETYVLRDACPFEARTYSEVQPIVWTA